LKRGTLRKDLGVARKKENSRRKSDDRGRSQTPTRDEGKSRGKKKKASLCSNSQNPIMIGWGQEANGDGKKSARKKAQKKKKHPQMQRPLPADSGRRGGKEAE